MTYMILYNVNHVSNCKIARIVNCTLYVNILHPICLIEMKRQNLRYCETLGFLRYDSFRFNENVYHDRSALLLACL